MEIHLGIISDKLSEEFPQIERIYLFGSRRFTNQSSRSDIDLLIEFKSHVKQKDILRFVGDECPALDIFRLEGGKATSFQNDSHIEFSNKNELLDELNAIVIWSQKEGRSQAPIDWKVEIDERVSYPPTILPNNASTEINYKNKNIAEINISELFGLIKRLKTGQFISLIGGIITIFCTIFYFGILYQQKTNTPLSTNSLLRENTNPQDSFKQNPTINFEDSSLKDFQETSIQKNNTKTNKTEQNRSSFSPQIFAITNNEENISSIRNRNNLRQLSTFESGKRISELSVNTFFFASIFFLYEFELQEGLKVKVQRFRQSERPYFEIHKYGEKEVYLIGFITESVLPRVSKFSGKSEISFTIFPFPNELTNYGIIIPFSRIISSDLREIQTKRDLYLDALDLSVR